MFPLLGLRITSACAHPTNVEIDNGKQPPAFSSRNLQRILPGAVERAAPAVKLSADREAYGSFGFSPFRERKWRNGRDSNPLAMWFSPGGVDQDICLVALWWLFFHRFPFVCHMRQGLLPSPPWREANLSTARSRKMPAEPFRVVLTVCHFWPTIFL